MEENGVIWDNGNNVTLRTIETWGTMVIVSHGGQWRHGRKWKCYIENND